MPEVVRSRRPLSFRVVAGGLVLSVLLVACIGAWAYFRYLRYERVAAHHLPADTTAAARIDVEQVVMFAPVRKHLVPLVDELGGRAARTEPRLIRIERETGVKLALELRELIVARGPTWADWVVIIGGRFPDDGVVEGMQRVLQAEGALWRLSADRRTLVSPNGIALGQAEDGAIVVASSAARLSLALVASQTYAQLGLEPEGGGSFASDGSLLRELAAAPAGFGMPSLESLVGVDQLRGTLTLGTIVEVETRLDLQNGVDAARFATDLRRMLVGFASVSAFIPGSDFAGERAALAKTSVEAAGPSRVVLRTPWPREDVERGAATLAAVIRDWAGTARR